MHEYQQKALECLRRTYGLIEAEDWKVEKVTKRGETICSLYREEFGKIYKLTCSLNYPAKALCYEIFHNLETVPQWNPTMLEATIKKRLNSYIEISHQATCRCGGGLIQSRDFVNLCSWRLFVDGEMTAKDIKCDDTFNENNNTPLPASNTNYELQHHDQYEKNGRMWLNAGVSVETDKAPPLPQYIRAENLVSGFAACEVEENPDVCIFEWILCFDLKGYIPRCILDKSYSSFMSEYMIYFRKHLDDLRQKQVHLCVK